MSVASIVPSAWWRPGCGDRCSMRGHDPDDHESYGRLLEQQASQPRLIRTGILTVDLHAGTAAVAGVEIYLRPRERLLLTYLAMQLGRWRSAEEILGHVWGPSWVTRLQYAAPDGDRYRSDIHVLAVARSRLRTALGDARSLIEIRPALGGADTRLVIREVTA